VIKGKTLILGTALWGWSIPQKDCFMLLDEFYQEGYRKIDTATNYPINKDSSLFRVAENILDEWIQINHIEDIEIIIKVGSLDNSGSAYNNLTKSFLLMNYDYYSGKFGSNLSNFMIHWDNRNSEKVIRETCEALKIINDKGNNIGLSGIKHPHVYHKISKELGLVYTIETKHNVFSSGLFHYQVFCGRNSFIGYGVNCGGIKFGRRYREKSSAVIRGVNTDEYQKKLEKLEYLLSSPHLSGTIEVKSFNDIGMIHAYNNQEISGIIIGPSRINQLKDSIDFLHKLERVASYHMYKEIVAICEQGTP
jgi:aryl-alcohol dehydrogenase-like predicted oxidoreductase